MADAHVTWGQGHVRMPSNLPSCLPEANSNRRENRGYDHLVEWDGPAIRVGSREHRWAVELAEKMGRSGAPLDWDVRGQYPAEVRALAEELADL